MQKKSKKAFTLVELIVVIALVGIVGLAVISMMVPASNVFNRMSGEVQAKMKASQVMQVLSPQLKYATGLEILNDPGKIGTTTTNRYIYTSGGKVYKNDSGVSADLFTSDFYGNYQIEMTANKIENNLVEIVLIVTLKSDSSVKSTLTTAVRDLNTQSIGGPGSGTILAYAWLSSPLPTTS